MLVLYMSVCASVTESIMCIPNMHITADPWVILAHSLSQQIKPISTELNFPLAVCWQHTVFILCFSHICLLFYLFLQSPCLSMFAPVLNTSTKATMSVSQQQIE